MEWQFLCHWQGIEMAWSSRIYSLWKNVRLQHLFPPASAPFSEHSHFLSQLQAGLVLRFSFYCLTDSFDPPVLDHLSHDLDRLLYRHLGRLPFFLFCRFEACLVALQLIM